MSTLHVVLGATGGAGSAITAELLRLGLPVRAVTRGAAPALAAAVGGGALTHLRLDITDPVQAAAAVRGASVVHMAAQPPYHRWPELFPSMLDGVARATAAAGATLVMVDNAYAYGPLDGPAVEDTAARATDRKGVVRAAMAQRLLRAHARGDLRAVLLRGSDYLGPDRPDSIVTALAVDPLQRDRGALRWPADLDQPHSIAYLPDLARAAVVLGGDDRAAGRTWHVPHCGAPTGRELLDLVNAHLPRPRPVRVIPSWALRLAAPVHVPSRETLGIIHQFDRPWVLDDTAVARTFGLHATSLATAVGDTLADVLSRRASVAQVAS